MADNRVTRPTRIDVPKNNLGNTDEESREGGSCYAGLRKTVRSQAVYKELLNSLRNEHPSDQHPNQHRMFRSGRGQQPSIQRFQRTAIVGRTTQPR